MVDPLSISFGVTGAAAVVFHSLHRLRSFIKNIEGAPKVIKDLSTDLDTLHNVLQNLKTVVNNSNGAHFGVQERILPLLDPPLRNCIKVLNSFDEKLKPYVKPSTRPDKSKWRSFLWTYREKDFIDLKTVLASHKASLEVALGAANLYARIRSLMDMTNKMYLAEQITLPASLNYKCKSETYNSELRQMMPQSQVPARIVYL